MNVTVEVTQWWATFGSWPQDREEEGRRIVLHGDVTAIYEAATLNEAHCRIRVLRQASPLRAAVSTAKWSQEPSGLWVFATIYLPGSFWEDFWLRTHHPLDRCRVTTLLQTQKGLPDGAMATLGDPQIEFYSGKMDGLKNPK